MLFGFLQVFFIIPFCSNMCVHIYVYRFVFITIIRTGLQLVGVLGAGSIPSDLPPPEPCDQAGLCWSFGSMASLSLTPTLDGQCHFVEWKSQFDSLAVSCSVYIIVFVKMHWQFVPIPIIPKQSIISIWKALMITAMLMGFSYDCWFRVFSYFFQIILFIRTNQTCGSDGWALYRKLYI